MPVMGWCHRRGKLWIQTTPWWSPADFRHLNHHGVLLRELLRRMSLFLSQRHPCWRMLGWSYSCVTDFPQPTSLLIPEGHNSGSSSLMFHQLQNWTAGPWEGWRWLILFTVAAALGQDKPGGYLALPAGMAALLGGPLFCSVLILFYWFLHNLSLLLSFLLVAFAVDCLWRYRIKSRSRFWLECLGPIFQYSWLSCQFGQVGCGWIEL